ncbi:hypothetical protein [Kribbella jiaozuonensis]|uniref:BON domain-containing protein n=1 Tax=Kribbella jiaozuonensis TaxID=2575441 RepID=A0A4U3LLN6_9ACTN|nr:hypothetical protein [Kribbella jiaozuonensis]TKK76432.1 hypothetical protein FDA38_29030 [Kribbella jiaozuonensis]
MDHESAWYEIRLEGRIDPRWAAWFDGMTLTHADGTTVLHGRVADQAALHGLLQRLRDLGLPLLSVDRVDTNQPQRKPL